MDVASSEFYKEGKYDLDFKVSSASYNGWSFPQALTNISQNPQSDSSKWLTGSQLAEVYNGYFQKFDICTIEDPFDQDDWEAWSAFNQSVKVQNVGDDLLVTNPLRIKTAIEKKACNALLLKVGFSKLWQHPNLIYCLQINQIGTISESIQA